MTDVYPDDVPWPGDPGFVPPEVSAPWDGVVTVVDVGTTPDEMAAAWATPVPPDLPPGAAVVELAARAADPEDLGVLYAPQTVGGKTPLGLPYPLPTDLLADAAAHVKALSDAVAVLLAAPGRSWGTDSQTANATGDIYVQTGNVGVLGYQAQGGRRGGTVGMSNYFYLFLLAGTYGSVNGVWMRTYGAQGVGQLAGYTIEYSFTAFGNPG